MLNNIKIRTGLTLIVGATEREFMSCDLVELFHSCSACLATSAVASVTFFWMAVTSG